MGKFSTLFHTVKYLKWTQVYHRLFYFVRNRVASKHLNWSDFKGEAKNCKLQEGMVLEASQWDGNQAFVFLNKEVSFPENIDWNEASNGKLWTYNLNYFEFLAQSSAEQGLKALRDFIHFYPRSKDGREPYPTALRLINTVKFCCQNSIEDSEVNSLIFSDVQNLTYHLEYHLLANHLLEDGFGLLFAGIYLQEEAIVKKASHIILSELKEQFQEDGLHYEQSPMYHSILLERILDSIALLRAYDGPQGLLKALEKTAENSLSFLDWCTLEDYFPLWNDAALGIAKKPSQIFRYASSLGISWDELQQASESGYRRLTKGSFDLFMDAGPVGPDYQPGHAHADTLTVDLFYKSKPIVVDPGTSTYEIGERRTLERSTPFHNTISIDGANSSDVWGGFRTAQRAGVSIQEDSPQRIVASHNGYKSRGITHKRRIEVLLEGLQGISISDELLGNTAHNALYSLHFHPSCKLELKENTLIVNHEISFDFSGISQLELLDYQYAKGFNKLQPAKRITGVCTKTSNCRITILSDNEN